MQQSSGTFSTTKCDIENTCVIHQKREIEIVIEWGINIKSQGEWGKCLDKALSLVPRFACAPQDNSYRPPCQKSPVPSANTFLFRGFRVRHGPRPILRRALGFLQNSTSLSTSGAYGTGFIDEPFTKGQICMNYAQHGRSNPQTVLIISCMWNAARSKHTHAAIKWYFHPMFLLKSVFQSEVEGMLRWSAVVWPVSISDCGDRGQMEGERER